MNKKDYQILQCIFIFIMLMLMLIFLLVGCESSKDFEKDNSSIIVVNVPNFLEYDYEIGVVVSSEESWVYDSVWVYGIKVNEDVRVITSDTVLSVGEQCLIIKLSEGNSILVDLSQKVEFERR